MPKLPVATAFWTPEPNLQTGAEAWILAGGAHHTAFSYDLTAEQMGDWAAAMGIEAVFIDKDTKIIFKNSFMPISLVYEYQYETNVINNIYTYDEAIDKAIELAKKKLLDKYKNIISISNIVIIKEEDLGEKVYLSLFVTSIEDITEYIEVTEEDNIK